MKLVGVCFAEQLRRSLALGNSPSNHYFLPNLLAPNPSRDNFVPPQCTEEPVVLCRTVGAPKHLFHISDSMWTRQALHNPLHNPLHSTRGVPMFTLHTL